MTPSIGETSPVPLGASGFVTTQPSVSEQPSETFSARWIGNGVPTVTTVAWELLAQVKAASVVDAIRSKDKRLAECFRQTLSARRLPLRVLSSPSTLAPLSFGVG
jgi:hypothetical protein